MTAPRLTFALTLSATLGSLVLGSAQAATVIKIASLTPLSGPASEQGIQIRNATQLAVNGAKADFAKLGFDLQFVSYDDQADPAAGTSAARRIGADKGILAIVGTQNSGVIIPASEALSAQHVAFVSPSTTNPKVTDRGLKNVNRICARDDSQGPAAADFMAGKLKAKKVYVLNDKTAYGQGLTDELAKALKARGVQVLSNEGTEERSDFSAIISKIQLMKPDAVYFGGLYGQVGVFARQLRDKGVNLPLVGADALDSPDLQKIAGNGAKNIYFTTIAPPLEAVPAGKAVDSAYKAAYKQNIEGYGIMGYDSAQVAIQGIRDAITANGKKLPSREQVETAIRKVKASKGLVTGAVQFNSVGDRVSSKMYIRQIDNNLKLVTGGVVSVTPKSK